MMIGNFNFFYIMIINSSQKQIARQVRYMFALAEVKEKTPKVREIMNRIESIYPGYPERDDDLCPHVWDTYTGQETPRQLGIKVESLYPKICGLLHDVKITDDSSIDELVEEYTRFEREKTVKKMREEIASWEIHQEELFPSSHSHASIH